MVIGIVVVVWLVYLFLVYILMKITDYVVRIYSRKQNSQEKGKHMNWKQRIEKCKKELSELKRIKKADEFDPVTCGALILSGRNQLDKGAEQVVKNQRLMIEHMDKNKKDVLVVKCAGNFVAVFIIREDSSGKYITTHMVEVEG